MRCLILTRSLAAKVIIEKRLGGGAIAKQSGCPSTSSLLANTSLLKPSNSSQVCMEQWPSLQTLCLYALCGPETQLLASGVGVFKG